MVESRSQVKELSPTRFVRLTAVGRSAIATLAVFGPAATQQVSLHFQPASGKRFEEIAFGQIIFGRWTSSRGTGEEVVVCRQREDRVDVHCHGGDAAVETIQTTLADSGCLLGQDHQLMVSEGHDPFSIEAWKAVMEARTRRGALLMLTQYQGALREQLAEICAALESGAEQQARERLQPLLQWGDLGLHITRSWKVALVGPPNAGKSSLVNALLGFRRSIVHHAPGTTRDLVASHTAWDGWPVQLIDTAGLRDDAEGLEQDGIDQVWQHQQRIDLVVLVFDGQESWSPDCQQLSESFSESLVVYNKSDLARSESTDSESSVESKIRPQGLQTSAVSGDGLERLIEEILIRLVPVAPGLGDAIPFTEQQVQLVAELSQLLDGGHLEEARERLSHFLARECSEETSQFRSGGVYVDD